MFSFFTGVLILIVGYFTYGLYMERIFSPESRPTPAIAAPDGVDRLPLPHWKNLLIHLLNIAGIGPVIGVILGIKFGAVVFILLPVGNIIGGAVHDYFSGMISLRHNGANTPLLVREYLGDKVYYAYVVFLSLTLLLVGAVFVNIPANILIDQHRHLFWPVVALVMLYYFASTFFPIDKIIGRVYPLFGLILLVSSAAMMIGIAPHLGLLSEISPVDWKANLTRHPAGEPVIPMLFVTIACGIISGFHSTQAPIVSRTMTSEKQGRSLFYGMMVLEGLIGMIWAAGGMALYAHSPELLSSGNGAGLLRDLVAWVLHPAFAQIALLGVVVLAITSGDTALRSLRLVLGDSFSINQSSVPKRLATTIPIFAAVALLLGWSNSSPDTFKVLWNYFSWSNQVIAAFALLVAYAYLKRNGKPAWPAAIPAFFMTFITLDYILFVSPEVIPGAPLGFGLPAGLAAGLAILGAALVLMLVRRRAPVKPGCVCYSALISMLCWFAGGCALSRLTPNELTLHNPQALQHFSIPAKPGAQMSIPSVWNEPFTDSIKNRLREEAANLFRVHALREDAAIWHEQRAALREQIWQRLGCRPDHDLPLEYKEHGRIRRDGYSIVKITYRSRPGIIVTGNLYIPDGEGPFPAVINMHGHWSQGRLAERVQARGHALAQDGYVALLVDAFGSGERSTEHGAYEYHGANLGASLMNVGETLMGMQIVDNMRGVDLLESLDFVDSGRIGATGASGGGNQTMWLTAMDDRIAASVPVVSVGSFESYVMRSNCICELLPDGLTFTEEGAVLALAAPRALKICNCLHDSNPTFYPSEMLRSFSEARKVYRALGVDDKLSYQVYNQPHGYWLEVRETMLGWFELHLKGKGTGAPKAEPEFTTLPEEELMIFEKGTRPASFMAIGDFCARRGEELREKFLAKTSFDAAEKRAALADILRLKTRLETASVHEHGSEDGWEKISLRTSCDRLIPLLVRRPRSPDGVYTIVGHPFGKDRLENSELLKNIADDEGLILFDLYGTGETGPVDHNPAGHHTLSRALLWLGRTLMGEWVEEFRLVRDFAQNHLGARRIAAGGIGEAGLAALFAAAQGSEFESVTLEEAPLSYLFSKRKHPIQKLTMAAHLPGFLTWGDVSLAAALAGAETRLLSPIRMDGSPVDDGEVQEWEAEVERVRKLL